MLENEQYLGAWVRLPTGMFERIAVAAENHHARLARHVDTTTLNGTCDAISSWLADLEAARTSPSPTPESGDLIIKLARGEFWMLTTNGWRELAIIEHVNEEYREQPYDVAAGHPDPEHVAGTPDFLVGPSEAVRAGWDERDTQPSQPRRFFGRSVIEDELDRRRGAQGAGTIPESGTIPRPWQPDERQQEILNELDNAARDVLDAVAALDGLPIDVADTIAEARIYAAGIQRARGIAYRWMHNLYGPQGIA